MVNDSHLYELRPYHDALSHSKIINKESLEFYTWIRIPNELCNRLSLYGVKVYDTSVWKDIDFSDMVFRENHRPWIRILTSKLDTSVGSHMYKFAFVDIDLDDYVSLYFAYKIQDDNPNKPYIYINRDSGDEK